MNWTKEELNKFTDDFNHWLYDIYFVMSTLDRYTVANCLGVISSTLMLISMFIGKFEGPSFIYQKAVAIFNSAMFFVIFFRILADRGIISGCLSWALLQTNINWSYRMLCTRIIMSILTFVSAERSVALLKPQLFIRINKNKIAYLVIIICILANVCLNAPYIYYCFTFSMYYINANCNFTYYYFDSRQVTWLPTAALYDECLELIQGVLLMITSMMVVFGLMVAGMRRRRLTGISTDNRDKWNRDISLCIMLMAQAVPNFAFTICRLVQEVIYLPQYDDYVNTMTFQEAENQFPYMVYWAINFHFMDWTLFVGHNFTFFVIFIFNRRFRQDLGSAVRCKRSQWCGEKLPHFITSSSVNRSTEQATDRP